MKIQKKKTLLLAGNPNAGKTTVFNRLTGLRQRVGNYPGVTVEKKSGMARLGGEEVEVIDLPGTYSLAASSPDEGVAVEAITGDIPGQAKPDAILCVVDATNLRRHLFLVSQICDFGVPVVLGLNMMDHAERKGVKIDIPELSRRLGIPVVGMTATTKEGWEELLEVLGEGIRSGGTEPPGMEWPEAVEESIGEVRAAAEKACGRELGKGTAVRLLLDSSAWGANEVGWGEPGRSATLETAFAKLRKAGLNPSSCEAVLRYERSRTILKGVVEQGAPTATNWSAKLDAVFTHRAGGLAVFAALMYLVFYSIYSLAGPLMDGINDFFGALGERVSPLLEQTPMLQSLVVDGAIAGVGGVLVFLPQILILFAFIGVLEDSGYMARAAFLMDRIFGWCGLNGKSFVPMLSSYACAIPGVMATRVISDPKARLLTILIAPLMSCSARLPVYVLMIGAFIEPKYGAGWGAFALFALNILGLAIAIPVAWILNRFVLKMNPQPFLLEMPAYRFPVVSNIGLRLWEGGREFVTRAGSVIFAFSIVIWALLYFPRPEEVGEQVKKEFATAYSTEKGIPLPGVEDALKNDSEEATKRDNLVHGAYLEQSYLAKIGKTVQPVFALAGFDWKITVGVLASFPAREVIISTMGIIYQMGGDVDEESDDLKKAMEGDVWREGPKAGQPVFTVGVALAVMVFFALCMQCGATVAVIAKESSWGWAAFAFSYMTALAWFGAVLTYQIASKLMPP